MNLVGNSRGGASAAAAHFLNAHENEHVEVYELRGFVSDDLTGALNEMYAISRGTKCQQFMYSLSLNPPPNEQATLQDFEDAIERVEAKLGLTDQPRAIVFHEKKGRRHAHCVWSRIDVAEMKAIQMSFDREKLQTVSRELFLEHGWKMPKGLANRDHSDPRNYSLAEWQQARRIHRHPNEIKREFEDAWAISDSKGEFISALEERGYRLAKGKRGQHVAVDAHGEVYGVARKISGIKTKDIRARLGEADGLPTVESVQKRFASEMCNTIDRLKRELEQQFTYQSSEYELRRLAMIEKQRRERSVLKTKLDRRNTEEAIGRQSRFRKGVAGLWDRINGKHRQIKRENERDALKCAERDIDAKNALIACHLLQCQQLAIFRTSLRREYGRARSRLERSQQLYRGPDP